jgi:hypothetical protein
MPDRPSMLPERPVQRDLSVEVERIISQLEAIGPDAAVAALAPYGTDAIDPLLEILADPGRGTEQRRIELVLLALRLGAPPVAVGEQILGATRTMSPLPVMAAELLKHKDLATTTPEIDAVLEAAKRLRRGIPTARALAEGGIMAPIVARAILYESRAASQRALAAWVLVALGERDEELVDPLKAVLASRDRAIVALATDALAVLSSDT